jgi:nucleoside triphosphatase
MEEQRYPEPACGALIFNGDKILLIKSHKWKGKYVIPGGHVELGERLVDALKREIKEETGLNIYDIEFICFQEFIYGKNYWKKRHFILFDFACKTKSRNVKLNHEGEKFVWVKIDEALKLPLETYTRKTIKEYLKRHKLKSKAKLS